MGLQKSRTRLSEFSFSKSEGKRREVKGIDKNREIDGGEDGMVWSE